MSKGHGQAVHTNRLANNVFSRVAGVRPGKSVFDLSYSKLLTCDMGQLVPVMCDEVVPGDIFEIANEMVIRFQPMVAPILHEINAYVHYFFCPYRLLWPNTSGNGWEDFITGGITGNDAPTLPVWSPTLNAEGSLWDFLGFPTGVVPLGALPCAFPLYAYNLVYNQFYADETLITPVLLTDEAVKLRAWTKDYFTSALPWQQRGTAPALPISGTTHAVWPAGDFGSPSNPVNVAANGTTAQKVFGYNPNNAQIDANLLSVFNDNTVDLSTATTFNVAQLRLAFQTQKWLERNARAGARYTEFLQAHYGVSPRDERLQRCEYIGGSKYPVIISEVLQVAPVVASGTPMGTLYGHGLTVGKGFAAKYRAEEFGLIIGIMSIMPKPMYQQGINKQWLKTTHLDFYSPEFAHLSERAIIQAEIYADGVSADNLTPFGYQGMWDELRVKNNMVCGQMRSEYDYWHLGRIFGSAPLLNQSFIQCNGPDPSMKRPFAVQNVPEMIVHFGNKIRAIRPVPLDPDPGLIDHDYY
nr:MAG: major capsid protein [Microviridae sp.]